MTNTVVNLSLKMWRHSKQVLPPSRQQQSRRNLQSAAELGKVINVFCHFFFFAFYTRKIHPTDTCSFFVILCSVRRAFCLWKSPYNKKPNTLGSRYRYAPITNCYVIGTRRGSRYQYIPRALLSVHTGPLYQYKEVDQTWASLSVHCTRRYVRINFALIVNQTRVVLLLVLFW